MKNCAGIWLPDNEDHLLGMIYTSQRVRDIGTYQLHKYHRALEFVRPSQRVALDIGAHVGLWSRVMSYDFLQVEAFEPAPAHLECFLLNCGALPNVSIHEMAVGEKEDTVHLDLYPGNTGHTQISVGSGNKVSVQMRRIDDEIDPGLEVDFVKIDVEGYEVFAVRGAERTIRTNRPCIIVEQKANNAEKFGRGRLDALLLLKSWGAVERDCIAGDHILSWDE